jgi:DNA adenine methylase
MNVIALGKSIARPFLKWAGGKGQLIPAIEAALPEGIKEINELTYVEPFVGSGAVMFWMIQQFPNIQRVIINDINPDLTKAYMAVKETPHGLINALAAIEGKYKTLTFEEDKKSFFLEKRQEFNSRNLDFLENTALLIFLNKTCYNGLYRVNSKNDFNVPFGRYDNPKICDADNIVACSKLLQKATILNSDYTDTFQYASENSFFYFDPPYKPISKTSSFNSYAKNVFDDDEQKRLKYFCDSLTSISSQWLLSNSDPKNNSPENTFFEDLYSGDSIFIDRVKAKRFINSNSAKRGEIFELLISNYKKIAV